MEEKINNDCIISTSTAGDANNSETGAKRNTHVDSTHETFKSTHTFREQQIETERERAFVQCSLSVE